MEVVVVVGGGGDGAVGVAAGDAEVASGPIWATENDSRVTKLGYWLRKLRLDELPQVFNVLNGSMSLVGPRPEPPHFVDQFTHKIPLYTRRLRVRPGITGWAQVKWKYDASLGDVKEKTKYDLYYVKNISLKLDIKILFLLCLSSHSSVTCSFLEANKVSVRNRI